MEILNKEHRLCSCCMEEHEVMTVRFLDKAIFKDEEVEFDVISEYCELADEYVESNDMISKNDIAMKNAYRKKVGLLTSDDICSIRLKYGISQTDLALLLGWGRKTITRYESHQVQDIAHDTILKKLNSDPEWFLALLKEAKNQFSPDSYKKYYETATQLFEHEQDQYLRKAILAQYAKYNTANNCNGGIALNLDKVIDAISYFANSFKVTALYKVKLMKMLWYADALSYKRSGIAMTGLVYRALPMGAVPIAHESIIDLKGISYEEIDFGDGTGYRFTPSAHKNYPTLSTFDIEVLDKIVDNFGSYTKTEIVDQMHKEVAYIETAPKDIIQFKYAKELSIS